MNLSMRNILLGFALLITIWLTWKTGQNNVPALSEPTRSISLETSPELTTEIIDGNAFKRAPRTIAISEVNLFASPVIKSFKPKSVKNLNTEPLVQEAPPLPFKYIGSFKDNKSTQIFIDVAGEVTRLKNGQIINSQYKVIDAQASTITFLYLPLNKKQTMYIGKTNHE